MINATRKITTNNNQYRTSNAERVSATVIRFRPSDAPIAEVPTVAVEPTKKIAPTRTGLKARRDAASIEVRNALRGTVTPQGCLGSVRHRRSGTGF